MADYPMWLNVRPLTTWPGELAPRGRRRRSQFSATLSSTRKLLQTELAAINARTMFTELPIPDGPDNWRLDGRPRSAAQPEHPGVVLSLPNTKVGPLRYAADSYLSWEENLRGIALTLQALRAAERYGTLKRGEQYVGSKALPPGGIPMPAGPMTEADALAFLVEYSGIPVHAGIDRAALDFAIRSAAKQLHPDRGGDTALFQRLQDAARVLRGES